MTIYSQIAKNKLRTLIIFFIFIFLTSGFFFFIGQYFENSTSYLIFGILFSFFSSFLSYFFSDRIILFVVGAKPANKKEFFDFFTVTENLAIASGLPMPKLYIIEDVAPNAFATGRDPQHAIVCVTSGLLKKLNRTELEGVIAHELSHIKNYDILLSSIVAIFVGAISIISDWILRNFWWSRPTIKEDEREEKSPLLYIFFILTLIVTPIIATLIQLAISRRREFLADASAALLTRYPEGLASALEKISKDENILRNANSFTAHLFIVNPFKKNKFSNFIANLFNTHPPIEERIRILRNM